MKRAIFTLLALSMIVTALGVGRLPGSAAARQATPEAAPAAEVLSEDALGAILARGFDEGVQARLAQASTAVQADQAQALTAAVHAGSCDSLSPQPVFALNAVEPRGVTAGQPATPVDTSYTGIATSLASLVGAPHAVVVAVGAGPAQAVACGDLGGVAQGDLFVGLREQNGSGLSGIAWLHAEAANSTRVSIFLAAGLGAGGGGVIDGPPPPPPVPGPDPVPPPDPGPGPVDPTNARTYVSPSHGYSLTYDASAWQVVQGPTSEEGVDYVGLANPLSYIDFLGVNGDVDVQRCLEIMLDGTRNRPGMTSVEPAFDANGAPLQGGNATDAFAVYNLMLTTQDGLPFAVTTQQRCISVIPGQSLLITEHLAPTESFASEAVVREQLYAGLQLP